MISAPQIRAARGLLGWSQAEAADAANVGLSTVRNFETGASTPIENNLAAIQRAFEAAGVEFTNGGQPGVRMRAVPFFLRPIDPSDAAWEASIVRSGIWVMAASEKDAREKAKNGTIVAVAKKPGKLSLGSPWMQPEKATCEQKACPHALGVGEIIHERGHRVD